MKNYEMGCGSLVILMSLIGVYDLTCSGIHKHMNMK